jgi:hypothetical protein
VIFPPRLLVPGCLNLNQTELKYRTIRVLP